MAPATHTVVAIVSAWPKATDDALWKQRYAFTEQLLAAAGSKGT